jgi:hypothetical protein
VALGGACPISLLVLGFSTFGASKQNPPLSLASIVKISDTGDADEAPIQKCFGAVRQLFFSINFEGPSQSQLQLYPSLFFF